MRRAPLLLALLLLAGCPTPPVARPYPPPTAAELLAHLTGHIRSVGSLRAETRVDYLAERGERIKLRMVFVVEAPDHLRMEAENPFGGSLASLASDGTRFQLLDVQKNRFLIGEASPCNVGQLIRVELSPAEVVAVVLGGAPLVSAPAGTETAASPAGEAAEVSWDPEHGGREVLTLRGPGGSRETIRLDARDRRWDVVEVELREPDGRVRYHVVNEEFSDEGGVRLPGRTTVYQPARDADARIRYRERELRPTLPPGAFHLDPPPGIQAETVTCH